MEAAWKTMDELRAETGYAAARFVDHWRRGEELAGGLVESELIDGQRMWRIVPPNASPAPEPAEEHPPASVGSGLPLDESGIHGRTLGALFAAGLQTSEDVVRLLKGVETIDEATLVLCKVEGVGRKGASDLLDWLAANGLSFADPASEEVPPAEVPAVEVGPNAPLADRFNAWLEANYRPAGRRDKLAVYDEDVQHQVTQRLRRSAGMAYGWEQLQRIRLGHTDLPSALRTAVARMVSGDTEREGQTTFGDLELGTEFPFEARHGLITARKIEAGYHSHDTWPERVAEGEQGPPYNAEHTSGGFLGNRCFFTNDAPVDFDLWPQVFRPIEEDSVEEEEDEQPIDLLMEPCRTCGQYHDEEIGHEPTEDFPEEQVQVERTATDGELVVAEFELTAEAPTEGAIVAPEAPADARAAALDSLWGDPVVVEADSTRAAALDALFAPAPASTPAPAAPKRHAPSALHPALNQCVPMAQHAPDSAAWHFTRMKGIGSSDVGAILGVSPHATIVDVWRSKCGEPERARPWLDLYSDFGRWFEPHLRRHCEVISGIEIIPGEDLGTLQSLSWERAQANIDGLDATHGVIEELKTSSEKWPAIPEAYFAQVQHQMLVTGCTEARIRQYIAPVSREHIMSLRGSLLEAGFGCDDALAAWLLEAGEVVTWIVEADDEYQSRMLDHEMRFWEHVEHCTEPPIHDPDGTVDLSNDAELVAALENFAVFASVLDENKPAVKAADKAKSDARRAIERAVSLLEVPPKRIVIGSHKATFVQRETHSYWNIYAGEVTDVAF